MSILSRADKLAQNYIKRNPVMPLHFRAFYNKGIVRGSDYRYHCDFNALFPNAKTGDIAHVRCIYKSGGDGEIGLTLTLFGSAEMRVNGRQVFKSNIFNERNNHIDNRIDIPVVKGDNLLELSFKKTVLGFGGIFGTWLPKWDYIFFDPLHPDWEGCQYNLNDGDWLPRLEEEEIILKENEYALFYTKDKNGNDVVIKSTASHFPKDENYTNPFGIEGGGAWVGLFPLKETEKSDFMSPSEGTYWRFKYQNLWLRPYYDSSNFGKWNYPLGVTLYGILRFGLLTKNTALTDYVSSHVKRCTDTLDYGFWDKEHNGGSTSLHNLLCSIDSLDDCGAFGSLVEEAHLKLGQKDTDKVCGFISDYIEHKQSRLSNGAFYRKDQLHSFHNETMWLDDLYMSVPFLCRRYLITKDEKYLNDCINQFLQYKKLLYMEEEGLMSHVFDFRHGLRNNVPWGRGNGWSVFSLSELLAVLPHSHNMRKELEEFFKELCLGYARVQSEDGRWHQVLNCPDSYLETSCSAMFACAFMRGVRMGLLSEDYKERAKKAVSSIVENCIDSEGNLHGVCRGSEFAFTADYYKNDLLPRINDDHGVGIVLLSVYEVMKDEA